ncbi:MAG: hypothetical protein ACRDOJ_05085 [Nocardioidaceae bacterium]
MTAGTRPPRTIRCHCGLNRACWWRPIDDRPLLARRPDLHSFRGAGVVLAEVT